MNKFAIICVLVLGVAASTFAELSCYQCNWSSNGFGSDDNCRNNPSKSYLRPCSTHPHDHNSYVCSKIIGRNARGEVVQRGCFPNANQNMRCTRNGDLQTCLCKNKDGCNGAVMNKSMSFSIFGFLFCSASICLIY